MELLSYIFIVKMGLVFSTQKYFLRNDFLFFCLWLLVFIGLSLLVRTHYDSDILNYQAAMTIESLSFYYWREPVVWIGMRYLFAVTGSSYCTFFIYDIVAGLSTFLALRRLGLPQYYYFAILAFFPFILGMQNIYRQWISCIFFLVAFSHAMPSGSRLKVIFFFILSVASHNMAAVFLPLLFANGESRFAKFVWFLSLLVAVLGVYIGESGKSSAATGADLSQIFLLLIFLMLVSLILFDRGRIKVDDYPLYRIFVSFFVIALSSVIILSSAGAERVVMFALIIAMPLISLRIEQRIYGVMIARYFVTVIGFSPIMIFGTRSFIIG